MAGYERIYWEDEPSTNTPISAENLNKMDLGIANCAAEGAEHTTQIETMDARIDEIVALPDGSTTADAELVDIRVGAGGNTYNSAGTAVRTQIKRLASVSDTQPSDPSNRIWIKGDAEEVEIPTMGELNEVKADLDENINDLKSALDDVEENFFGTSIGTLKTKTTVSGLYMSAVNNINAFISGGSGLVVYYIPVSKGEKYRIICPESQLFSDEYIAVGFAESVPAVGGSVTPIEIGSTTAKNINTLYEVQANGYLCLQKSRITTSDHSFVAVQSSITDIAQEYIKIYDYTETPGYFASNGSVQQPTADLEVYTSKLAVHEGEKLNWFFAVGDNSVRTIWVACVFYDIAENVVGGRNALKADNNIFANGSITIPSGVSYVAFTYRTFGVTTMGLKVHGSFGFDKFLEIGADVEILNERVQTDFKNSPIKSINHRGFNSIAPENTLPAFKLSKTNGFGIVETDIRLTSDNVPVLLHDAAVDRTSNGSGSIYDMTFAQARELDFGSWKSETYTGTKIPSLEEFLTLCKRINLYAYCELETPMTETQVCIVMDVAKRCGMLDKITWISFSPELLRYAVSIEPTARIGVLFSTGSSAFNVGKAVALRTGYNEVFADLDVASLTSTVIEDCINNELPLEVWTIDTESGITSLDAYVSGVTSDNLIAEKVMYDANIN